MDLFGTLNLGQRSLQAQQQGIQVTGHNLANVNQTGYTRQRLVIQTSPTIDTPIGQQGTGVEGTVIEQIRDTLLDRQMESEISVRGSLETQQQALELAQAKVGQQINRQAAGTEGSSVGGVTGQNGLAEALSGFFNGFQDLAAQPTSAEARTNAISQAQNVAGQFNNINRGLAEVDAGLNRSIQNDVGTVNKMLGDIARLNNQIAQAESNAPGTANDLRDSRQQIVESLAKISKVDVVDAGAGRIDISLSGTTLVSGGTVSDTLETYDAGGGNLGVRTKTGAAPLTIGGGSLHGAMEVRDTTLAGIQKQVDQLAGAFIAEVNKLHSAGFSLTGSTGADFFTGTDSATIRVNTALADNPALIQAGGVAGARSDNQTALRLAQLGSQPMAALGGNTFNDSYTKTVTALGESLSGLNARLEEQRSVEDLLQRQRDSVSGVSMDEEMTNLIKYQKAFQASAKLITTVDEMLNTVLSLVQ